MGGLFETSILQGEIKNNYNKQEIIDYNAYGVTHKSREKKTGKIVAIKIINKKYLEKLCGPKNLEKSLEGIRQEIENLKKMTGDYSLNIIEGTETNDSFYIISEIWDSNLQNYILNKKEGLNIDEIKDIFKKLNVVFKRMKENKIIHGNLTLNNILIKNDNNEMIPLLNEYGKKGNLDEKLNIMQTTSEYSAPELLIGENYNYKIDLWSIGIILYKLYFNEFPYNGETQVSIYNDIKKHKNLKKCEENPYFNDLIKKLLIIDPNDRMDWDSYFNHKFWEFKKKEVKDNDNIDNKENEDKGNIVKEKKEYKYLFKKKEYLPKNKYYNIVYCLYTYNEQTNSYDANLENKKKIEIIVDKEKEKNEENDESIDTLISKEIIKSIQLSYLSKLVLYGCNLNNINILTNLPAINLIELDLSRNQIENLEPLSSVSYQYLVTLNLSNNNIHDISPLIKVYFKNLRNLNLSHNFISDIEPLAQMNFPILDKLKLSSNKIRNIDVLIKVPFAYLTYLNLSNNKISESSQALAYISLTNLLNLDLSHNLMKNLDGLNSAQYKNLTSLNVSDNDISNIDILKEVYFTELVQLSLSDNNIDNGYVFAEVPFIKLKELNLSYNNIENIDFVNYLTFKNLERLDLNGNKIDDLSPLNQIELNNLKEMEIKYNKFKKDEGNETILNNLKTKYNDLKLLYK